MKLFTFTLCLYLNVLTVLPSVKAISMTFFKPCEMTCNTDDSNGGLPNGCEKEKCVVNFNFNNVTFLVFTTDYQMPNGFVSSSVKENIQYHNSLKSNFSVTIWQPPEFFSVA